jgi:hypothetical protein
MWKDIIKSFIITYAIMATLSIIVNLAFGKDPIDPWLLLVLFIIEVITVIIILLTSFALFCLSFCQQGTS